MPRTKTLHFRVVSLSRHKDRPDNAVKACAYRSGQRLYDEKEETHHNYSNKGGVIEAEIFAPGNAPDWMHDSSDKKRSWERFGNEIEEKEDSHNRRASALLAKDFQVAAPRELNHEQNWQLAQDFAAKINDRGLAVAVAFHEEDASDGGKNPHFHFMVAMREVEEDGFGKRYRDFDAKGKGKNEVMQLRRDYYQLVNEAVSDAGFRDVYYDPEKQEDKEPGIHKGKNATAQERKGEDTRVAQYNRRVKYDNFMHKYEKSANADGWINPPSITAKKHEWNERVEGWRMNRGSAMASRDLSRRSQSNVAAKPVYASEKATERAREGAILAARQSQSWQERVERSRDTTQEPPKPAVQPQSFQDRVKQPHKDMERT